MVGAVLDRVAYAHTMWDLVPLELASRAELAVRIVDDADGWELHELLGA